MSWRVPPVSMNNTLPTFYSEELEKINLDGILFMPENSQKETLGALLLRVKDQKDVSAFEVLLSIPFETILQLS